MRVKERCELLASCGGSLTESFGQKSDVHTPKPTLFENYHCGKLSLHLSIRRNGDRSDWCLEMHRFRKVFGLDVEFPVSLERDNVAWSRPAPGKLSQGKLEFSRKLNGRTEHEEEPVHGRADHRDSETA